jgi:hypothetical protein
VADPSDVNQVGKRYACSVCQTEVICVKAGAGRISCHGDTMPLLGSKALPSTD